MKILHYIVFCLCCSFSAGEETTPPIDANPTGIRSEAFGRGQHFKFSLDEWNGEAQLITRLKKNDEIYLYLRTSEQEFNIQRRISESKSETLFKFFLSMPAITPYLRDAVLVDILHNKEQAAILMVSARGYFYLKSSSTPPQVDPPKHFIPNKKLGNWIPRLIVTDCDYYWDSPSEADLPFEKVLTARLSGFNEIEFTPIEPKDKVNRRDVFSISDEGITKNGKPFRSKYLARPISNMGIIDEITFSEASTKMSLEEIRKTLTEQGITKEELMEIIGDFIDKKAAATVKNKLNEAFPD